MRVIAGIAFVALLSGCSSGLNRPVKEVTATVGADQVQQVTVTTHSFWFEPNRIVVHAGKPVVLHVRNGSWIVPHNLTLTAPETDVTVSADVGFFGRSKTVRFTPTKTGEYHFGCHVDSHGKKGMRGTLVVVE
jgi:plastocyanin